MERVIFQRISERSTITVVAEADLITMIQDNGLKILQIIDLLGSRPINVLRYLVEYELSGIKLLEKKLKGGKSNENAIRH